MSSARKEAPLAASGEPCTRSSPLRRGEPSIVELVVRGRIGHADADALCERIRKLLAASPSELVVCDVRAVTDPDIGTVEVVARLALTARRLGSRIELRHACSELRELLALTGLDAVAPCGPS